MGPRETPHRRGGRRSRPYGERHNWGRIRGYAVYRISAALAAKRYQFLFMATVTTHTQKAAFEAIALEVVIEFPTDMSRQTLALLSQLRHQGGVMLFNELVEKCLLGSVALVGDVADGILTMQ